MSGLLLNSMVLLALSAVVLSALVPAVLRRRRGELGPAAKSAQRRSVLATAAATLASLVIGLALLGPSRDELVVATAPALIGLVSVVVATMAERLWPRVTGTLRSAGLRRAGRGTTSRALLRLAVGGGSLSAALLMVGLLTGADEGRGLELTWPGGATTAGPYPGTHYTWPMVGTLAVLGLATWWGLRTVDARPALGIGLEQVDEAARESSRVRVLRGAAFGALVTAGALISVMSLSVVRVVSAAQANAPVGEYSEVGWSAGLWVARTLLFVGFGIATVGLLAFVATAPPLPAEADGADDVTGSPLHPMVSS